ALARVRREDRRSAGSQRRLTLVSAGALQRLRRDDSFRFAQGAAASECSRRSRNELYAAAPLALTLVSRLCVSVERRSSPPRPARQAKGLPSMSIAFGSARMRSIQRR